MNGGQGCWKVRVFHRCAWTPNYGAEALRKRKPVRLHKKEGFLAQTIREPLEQSALSTCTKWTQLYVNTDFLCSSHVTAARCESCLCFMLKLGTNRTSVVAIFQWEAHTCPSCMHWRQLKNVVSNYPINTNIQDRFQVSQSFKIAIQIKAFFKNHVSMVITM